MPLAVRAYRLPLRRTYRWAKGEHATRAGAIVRAELDGAVGWGEVAFGPHVEVEAPKLEAEIAGALARLDAGDDDFLAVLDRLGLHNRIRAGIAGAWLSAQAAAAGLPLNRYLARRYPGAGRDPQRDIPINGLVGERDAKGALEQCAGYVAQGMKTFKIKCFGDEGDLERVRAIRAAYPDAILRLDPNDAWKSVEEALRHIERFAPLGIEYIEDPLDTHATTLEEMADLRARSAVPVAWDNPVDGVAAMQRLIGAGAVDVFIFKMSRGGGPDRQLAMIDLAHSLGFKAVMTDPIETGVGMLASLQVTSLCPAPIPDSGFSLSGYYARDIVEIPPIERGVRRLPDSIGLGVDPTAFWNELR